MEAFASAAANKSNFGLNISASALAVENPLDMKSEKAIEIVHRLMTRAVAEGRAEEMIQKIVPRIHKVKQWVAEDAAHLAFVKELDKASMSPTIRIFNMQAKAEGRNEMLYDHTGTAQNLTDQEAQIANNIVLATNAPPILYIPSATLH